MEGSTVRGQKKNLVVQLNETQSLENFQADIIKLLESEFKQVEILFGIVDAKTNVLQLPAWIKSHLERQPGLYKKLEQGEMVGISAADQNPSPRPAAAVRSSLVLIPLLNDGRLNGAIGLVSPLDGPQLPAEDIEVARQFAYEAAPIMARLQEIERLRRENQELTARASRSDRIEEERETATEERNILNAILQMRSHQQVNVAHELRTPLAAIRGYTRMILDGRAGEVNETQKEYLRIVTESTNRMISLVGWMSYVAELSAQHLTLGVFDFREVWFECAGRIRNKLAEKSLKLIERIVEEHFEITADRDKLGYVLDELLGLAMRLAEVGGSIEIELSHGRENELNFKVSQGGASIPAEVFARIFDRPSNAVAKPIIQNTESGDISLAGVYDVIGMHGGRVFVNSIAGQGAMFLFTLPAVTAVEENSHEQAIHSGRRRR